MPYYKIHHPPILTFFERESPFTLKSIPNSLLDGTNVFTNIVSSLHEDGTYRPNQSIFLEIPTSEFPHIALAYDAESERIIDQRIVECYDYIHDIVYGSAGFRLQVSFDHLRTLDSASDYLNQMFERHYRNPPQFMPTIHMQEMIRLFITCALNLRMMVGSMQELFMHFKSSLSAYIHTSFINGELNVRVQPSTFSRHNEGNPHDYAIVRYQERYYIRLSLVHLGKRYTLHNPLFEPFIHSPFKEESEDATLSHH